MEPVSPLETAQVPTLKDLLEDGFYLLFLLRNGHLPQEAQGFNQRLDQYLRTFEQRAAQTGKGADAVRDAKYAFCALTDEIVLSSATTIRSDWERDPLQLRLFGEHLAGEGFFLKLEQLRLDPARHVETLEVFHTCLLLGFQGRYLLEGPEKLGYLITRLSQEITQVRGGRVEFAPHVLPNFRFTEFVRHELPMVAFYGMLAVVAVGCFILLSLLLNNQVKHMRGIPQSGSAQRLSSGTGMQA